MCQSRLWFRCYSKIIDDDQIRILAYEDRWHFLSLLACAAQGIFDDCGDDEALLRLRLAVKLGLDPAELDRVAERLRAVRLLGPHGFLPPSWSTHQFNSDTSGAQRMRQSRAQQRAASSQDWEACRDAATTNNDGMSRESSENNDKQSGEADNMSRESCMETAASSEFVNAASAPANMSRDSNAFNALRGRDNDVTTTRCHSDVTVTAPDTETDTETDIEGFPSSSSSRADGRTHACVDAHTRADARAHTRGGGTATDTAQTKRKRAKTERGTRLSLEDLPDDWRHWCEVECPQLHPDRVWSVFVDYWASKPGQSGVRLRWCSVWRNWCRRERERAAPHTGVSRIAATRAQTSAERNVEIAAQLDANARRHFTSP